MSGFEPHCQRVGEEISRDEVEDLSGRKHACLFFYLCVSFTLSISLSLSVTLSLSYSVCFSFFSPPTQYLAMFDPFSLSVCSFSSSSEGTKLLYICMKSHQACS